jgi:carbon monoxide dehydrogenase subunit G
MRFEHTIDIDAPPDRVWAILSDLPPWGTWTTSVKSFEWVELDLLAEGAKARLELQGAPPAVWTVTSVDEGKSFVWEARIRGVYTVAGHYIAPRGGGSSLTLTLDQTGLLATLIKPMISKVSRRNMQIEAEGLKRASEAAVTA